jgi:AcrR family transcriptional regulator
MLLAMGVRKAKAAETGAALKQAAKEQFVARGYLNTKITDITTAAGRSTGSFYEHFASKEQLLEALLGDIHAEAHDEFADSDHPPHDLTEHDQLRTHLALGWRLIRANRAVSIALFEQAITSGPADGQLWRRLTDDTRILREHLEHATSHGRRTAGDPTIIAAAIGAMLSMLAYALPPDTANYADDDILDTLTALLLGGLAGTVAK